MKLNKNNSLLINYPKLCEELHPIKNGNLEPKNFSYGSKKKTWWLCPECSCEWEASIRNRAALHSGCPACAGKIATKNNCLFTTHPKLCEEWDKTKNGNLFPQNITAGSSKKVWWVCNKCKYEWQAPTRNRTNGSGCPACVGKVATKNNCLHTNTPKLIKEWHPSKNGNLTPKNVTVGSNKKVWWVCEKCGHEWETSICLRTRGSGCPGCVGQIVNKNNCLFSHYPKVCEEWHPGKNGDLTPEDVTTGTNRKVWWMCKKCNHEWEASISKRTSGRGCPKCAKCSSISKTGSKWLDKLGISIENREVPIKIENKRFVADGYDPKTKTVYEYLGNFWHGNPEMFNSNDINPLTKTTYGELYRKTMNKISLLEKHGYNVIYKWGR